MDENLCTVPISNSYSYLSENEADPLYDNFLEQKTNSTGTMFRTDLFQKNTLYTPFDSETKFYAYPTNLCYGGDASVSTGFCRRVTKFSPTPYPIMTLTEDRLKIYHYLGLFSPFLADEKQMSSFVYLPAMFAMSMLKNGFKTPNEKNKYIDISDPVPAAAFLQRQV